MALRAVIVFGGRYYGVPPDDPTNTQIALAERQRIYLNTTLESIRPDVVIQGGAKGADMWAARWAARQSRCTGIPLSLTMPAQWKARGRVAGPLRNREMAEFLIGFGRCGYKISGVMFPGGRGTEDMHSVLEERNIPVIDAREGAP